MTATRPFPVDTVSKTARTLVLAPHPDDFDVIGVTLKRVFQRAPEMRLLVVTSGHSGVEDDFVVPAGDLAAKRKAREAEQLASAAFFGLAPERVEFLAAEGGNACLASESGILEPIRAILAVFQPDLLFLPHGNDSNPDHQIVCRTVLELIRQLPYQPSVFLNADPKTVGLRPDFMTVFDEQEAEWKAELLRFHASQHRRNLRTRGIGFDQRILANNRELAFRAGFPDAYLELFEQSTLR